MLMKVVSTKEIRRTREVLCTPIVLGDARLGVWFWFRVKVMCLLCFLVDDRQAL